MRMGTWVGMMRGMGSEVLIKKGIKGGDGDSNGDGDGGSSSSEDCDSDRNGDGDDNGSGMMTTLAVNRGTGDAIKESGRCHQTPELVVGDSRCSPTNQPAQGSLSMPGGGVGWKGAQRVLGAGWSKHQCMEPTGKSSGCLATPKWIRGM